MSQFFLFGNGPFTCFFRKKGPGVSKKIEESFAGARWSAGRNFFILQFLHVRISRLRK